MKLSPATADRSFCFAPARVQFCGCGTAAPDAAAQRLAIGGLELVPDAYSAFVEFKLAHAFPVVNNYHTAIHPQVLSNSYRTLQWKCFNFAHLMRANSADNPRDHILGCVLGVEFPPPPEGGWQINFARENAPGIRAAAVMFKQAEKVGSILSSYASGRNPWGEDWTVSMENLSWLSNSGFLVKGAQGVAATHAAATPPDLQALGYTYVPALQSPDALLGCLNTKEDDARDGITSRRVCRQFHGQETLLLLGGLDGEIFFNGVGLCPGGAQEVEAHVAQMLAAERVYELAGHIVPDFFAPLRHLLRQAESLTESRNGGGPEAQTQKLKNRISEFMSLG